MQTLSSAATVCERIKAMTVERSPLDAALDLVVFAPVGLVITAAEQLPGFAEKGRARVESRVAAARMVGRFAFSQGSRELARRRSMRVDNQDGPGRPDSSDPSEARNHSDRVDQPAGTPPEPGSTERVGSTPLAAPPAKNRPAGSPTANRPPDRRLAIPGYDSLSASQVVSRLAGLTADELADVASYEAANRGRRTVINRIRQLQG